MKASELRAKSVEDLHDRLERIFIGFTYDGEPVYLKSLEVTGALMALLRDAVLPAIPESRWVAGRQGPGYQKIAVTGSAVAEPDSLIAAVALDGPTADPVEALVARARGHASARTRSGGLRASPAGADRPASPRHGVVAALRCAR